MAELVLAYRYAFKLKEDDKYHLSLARQGDRWHVSICKEFEIEPNVLTQAESDKNFVVNHISDINPEDFCKKCLGPMKALPNP